MSRSASLVARGVVVVAIAFAAWWLQETGRVEQALGALRELGPAAAPLFVVLHALSVPLFVPSLLPTLAAGAIFGFGVGFPLTVLGVALGSGIALAIGRYLARGVVEARVGSSARFRTLARAVETRGWKIVALARLSPIVPFSIANYAFGLTRIPVREYGLASGLGTLPSNAVYVWVGALSGSIAAAGAEGRARTSAEWALLVGGLLATIGLTIYLRGVAERTLEREGAIEEPGGTVRGRRG